MTLKVEPHQSPLTIRLTAHKALELAVQDDHSQLQPFLRLRVDEHGHDLDIMANIGAVVYPLKAPTLTLEALDFLLAEEDRISLNQLAPSEVQEWCLSRMAECQEDNRRLAKAGSKNNSHMRALRSVYNDAAPINQHLLPEMFMEIFAHVHPAVVPRSHIPVLRVCRYWRRLLFRTSEFWDNLLSLPTWDGWNPRYQMTPFRAALTRSASTSLVVFVPYYSQAISSILIPHASRLSSFKAGPTVSNPEGMTLSRLKEEILYRTRRRYGLYMYGVVRKEEWRTAALTFSFSLFPNLRSLELRKTYIRPSITAYPSLSHLKLDQCAIRPTSSGGQVVPPLIAVHAALESFPNLEVLSLIRCLSPPYNPDRVEEVSPVPDLKETVHLPRLCHLELVDTPAYIPPFLSHLVFPTTTSLVLEPTYAHDGSQGPAVAPLFPRINPSSSPSLSPSAELTLSLHFPAADGRSLARWETRGERTRPVRVTLPHAAFTSALVARYTRDLVDVLAPRRGVAALAVHGRFRHREVQSDPVEYWEELARALPGLRHLACEAVWTTRAIVAVLGKRESWGGFSCARLGEVVLGWSLTHGIDLGHGDGQWRALQRKDDGSPRDDRISEPAKELALAPECQLAEQLSDFCDTVRPCLSARAGHCERIGKLMVSFHCDYFRCKCRDGVLEVWQAALIEQRLRDSLGDLVGDVVVGGRVS